MWVFVDSYNYFRGYKEQLVLSLKSIICDYVRTYFENDIQKFTKIFILKNKTSTPFLK